VFFPMLLIVVVVILTNFIRDDVLRLLQSAILPLTSAI